MSSYYQKNKEKIKQKLRENYYNNKEKAKEYYNNNKERLQQYYENNKEYFINKSMIYYYNNIAGPRLRLTVH